MTPSWYQSKLAVPTWNYVTVHAYGIPTLVDIDALRQIVTETVEQYESPRETPWRMDLPEEYMSKMLAGIVGLEIPIARIEGKLKLNQNRSKSDVSHVIGGFESIKDSMLQDPRNVDEAGNPLTRTQDENQWLDATPFSDGRLVLTLEEAKGVYCLVTAIPGTSHRGRRHP